MTEQQIFRNGSTTYYWSSKFFPASIRQDVFDLYSFVRVADDYVDQTPADKDGFYRLRRTLMEARKSVVFSTVKKSDDTLDLRIVKNIVRLQETYNFEWPWIDAFLDAMQSDLVNKDYSTIDDSLKYVYGSAEVVGLMMAKIMQLPTEADKAARMQGRAMQWINFIRDIDEDNGLGRRYFPAEDLERFSLPSLSKATAEKHPEEFAAFIKFQIDRYFDWQTEAEAGYHYIPKRLLIPLRTASDMYGWTARSIAKEPLVIYRQKVKPDRSRIIMQFVHNVVR